MGKSFIGGLFATVFQKLIFFVVTFLTFGADVANAASSSTQLFGPSSSGFVNVDPATGATTIVNSVLPGYLASGGVLDPATHREFLIDWNTYNLLAVDTRTGNATTITTFTSTTVPLMMVFDPGTGKLFGLSLMGFISVDPGTGTTTVLNSQQYAFGNFFTLVPATHQVFFTDGAFPPNLLVADTRTGVVTTIEPLNGQTVPTIAAFDSGSGMLFGVAPGGFVSINPATGALTILNSAVPGSFETSIAVDPSTHRAFIFDGNSNLLSVDTRTGTVTTVAALNSLVEPWLFILDNGGSQNLGDCHCNVANAGTAEGNPISVATGNKYQEEQDFVGAAQTQLSLARYYNSQDATSSAFGTKWHSTYHRGLSGGANQVTVKRADGREETFVQDASGVWVASPDITDVLTHVANGRWQLQTVDDTVEQYSSTGQLLTITSRAGLVTTLAYNASNLLAQVTGPFGHVMSFAYDGSGHVSKMNAPDGGIYGYAYDANNNLTSVSYPDGSKRQYVYENTSFPNALTGIIDENGNRFATWSYDSSYGRGVSSQHAGGADLTTVSYGNNASTVNDARGNAHGYNLAAQYGTLKPVSLTGTQVQTSGGQAFTYDVNGFISSITDWDGNVTTYTHDSRGDETSRTEAFGTGLARTISTQWHPTFHLPTQITEPNRTTNFYYDANGNLKTKTITATAGVRSFGYTYNTAGQVLTATDPRGNITQYGYDTKGDLASVTDALGNMTNITSYDPNGRPKTIVDPNGVTTSLTYDLRGRLTSRKVAALETIYSYDLAGNLIRVTQPDGSYLAYSYDPAHRLTGITDALGNSIAYELDLTSNITTKQVRDPSKNIARTQSYAYDSVNRLNQMIGAQGQTTTFGHDPQGNLTSVADPLGDTTNYYYDALNRLAYSIDPTGGNTTRGYNANDHLNSVTDPRGLQTGYGWDGLDDQTSIASPDTGTTNKTFDAAGNVLTSTDARGKTTSYRYDALNRRTKASFADGTSIAWQYDQGAYGVGRLSLVTDALGSTSYSYDANGHVLQKTRITESIPLTTRYFYNAGGQLYGIIYPSNEAVGYFYDAAGRVTSVKAADDSNGLQNIRTLVSNVTYQPFGGVSGWTAGDGVNYFRSFDQDGRIAAFGASIGATQYSRQISYDAAGRIKGMTGLGAPKSFIYDEMNRLKSYANGSTTQSYSYDANGNRTSYSSTSPSVLLNYAYAPSSNRLQGVSGSWSESYTYDAAGNTLTHASPSADYAFTYDGKNRMSGASLGALTTVYGYNDLGQRLGKAPASQLSSATLFAYDEAGHLLGEYNTSGKPANKEIVWLGDVPIARIQKYSPSVADDYILPNHLNAPLALVGQPQASGVPAIEWVFDPEPFGNSQPSGGAQFNLRFPGQYADAETGLNYNGFRDYDPKTGRYIESDPIGLAGGINTYAYVEGNPGGMVDPTGQYSWNGAIIGGATGMAYGGLGALLAGGDRYAVVTGMFIGGTAGALTGYFAPTNPLLLGAIGGATDFLGQKIAHDWGDINQKMCSPFNINYGSIAGSTIGAAGLGASTPYVELFMSELGFSGRSIDLITAARTSIYSLSPPVIGSYAWDVSTRDNQNNMTPIPIQLNMTPIPR